MSQRRRLRGGRLAAQGEAQAQEEEMETEEDVSFIPTQSLSQVRRNLEKRSSEQVDRKVNEVVQCMLIKDQKKIPIRRADIIKNVIKEYRDVYPEIITRAGRTLEQVFGLRLEEIDSKNHVYILLNKLESVEGDRVKVGDNTPKMGLLMVILSLIFMKGNVLREALIWETLKKLRVNPSDRHQDLGDVKKLVTEEFVRQKYLEYNRVPHTDPVEYEFRWGPRAIREISKMKVLEFVAKIQKKEPQSWVTQWKEASAEATTGRGTSKGGHT
ncbi:necdin-like 2 [Latimeria chalumnae]|uniref:MAGE domain-containing protein n=1 Tax=Latimeria chalumnae TaxID=7897 RepID=H3ATT9_LATCH|nr:PREDICTED: melanoma-associated antigen G1-like [Latimeria chalumnae]XP_006004037.1 PREDICTED: melanoma-associated antigen G1-like [Latimeria chalumnae]|eukprot:XP_006004036.1 PREDICTED: melanoma-associated antigen G1-like [Latimeria chalumnae]